MKTYNISINQSYLSNNITNIDISKIPELINDSIDTIFLNCLEALSVEDSNKVIYLLLDKLGLNGMFNIVILNSYSYIADFMQHKITSNNFLQTIHKQNNLITIDDIISILDTKKYQIYQISYKDYHTHISIAKVSL